MLGKIGYKMSDLYDTRNDPSMINKLLLFESVIEDYNIKQSEKIEEEMKRKHGQKR